MYKTNALLTWLSIILSRRKNFKMIMHLTQTTHTVFHSPRLIPLRLLMVGYPSHNVKISWVHPSPAGFHFLQFSIILPACWVEGGFFSVLFLVSLATQAQNQWFGQVVRFTSSLRACELRVQLCCQLFHSAYLTDLFKGFPVLLFAFE